MGREIQKKKMRSGIQKTKQKPKSKKRILSNPVIAANWDKSQTLTQNYQRLGLAAKLNKHTGGTERKAGDVEQLQTKDGLVIGGKKPQEAVELGEVRIRRDPETGAILEVLDGQEQGVGRANPLGDPLNDLDSSDDDEGAEEQASWARLANQHGNIAEDQYIERGTDAKTDVVKQLEARASRPAAKHRRKMTENERAFVEELVRKYGEEDYARMSRDLKINYMQRSEGDIRKRVLRWKEEGGSV